MLFKPPFCLLKEHRTLKAEFISCCLTLHFTFFLKIMWCGSVPCRSMFSSLSSAVMAAIMDPAPTSPPVLWGYNSSASFIFCTDSIKPDSIGMLLLFLSFYNEKIILIRLTNDQTMWDIYRKTSHENIVVHMNWGAFWMLHVWTLGLSPPSQQTQFILLELNECHIQALHWSPHHQGNRMGLLLAF